MNASSPPSFLCLPQESSAPKSLGAGDTLPAAGSFTAQTRRGWIPVTGTGMRVYVATATGDHDSASKVGLTVASLVSKGITAANRAHHVDA